jgi:hypothetical protein
MSTLLTLLIPMILLGLFLVFNIGVFLWEKQFAWALADLREPVEPVETGTSELDLPYAPPQTNTMLQELLPISPIAKRNGDDLRSMGYHYLGSFRHAGGGIYRLRFDTWVSHDHKILAFVCGGKLLVPINSIRMTTLYQDDQVGSKTSLPKCFQSITLESSYTPVPSDRIQTMLFPGANARKADELHRRRLAQVAPIPFTGDPLKELRQYRMQIIELANQRGCIRFLDTERNAWRPSVGTALWMMLSTYAFMLPRRFIADKWKLPKA